MHANFTIDIKRMLMILNCNTVSECREKKTKKPRSERYVINMEGSVINLENDSLTNFIVLLLKLKLLTPHAKLNPRC